MQNSNIYENGERQRLEKVEDLARACFPSCILVRGEDSLSITSQAGKNIAFFSTFMHSPGIIRIKEGYEEYIDAFRRKYQEQGLNESSPRVVGFHSDKDELFVERVH